MTVVVVMVVVAVAATVVVWWWWYGGRTRWRAQKGRERAIINNTAASRLHFTALTVDNCATIMLAAVLPSSPSFHPLCYPFAGARTRARTRAIYPRRGQVMKFDWKLTTMVYTRAQAFPAGTTHDSEVHAHEYTHTRACTRYYGKRERRGVARHHRTK